jgi:hypothetical protein
MKKNEPKKGDKEKLYLDILEKNPEGMTRVEIREKTGLKTSTEADITKRLLKKKTIGEKEEWNKKTRSFVKKYYLLYLENLANNDELKWLMQSYRDALSKKDTDRTKMLQKDIESICLHKKIRDKDFIRFIVEEAQKPDYTNLKRPITDINVLPFRRCLGHVAISLTEALDNNESLETITGCTETSLLSLINHTTQTLKEAILDKKRPYKERAEALESLTHFRDPDKFEVAFELLKKIDAKEKRYGQLPGSLLMGIEYLILSYSRKDIVDCRKRLYDLIHPETNEIIKHIAMNLLDQIRTQEYK